MWNSYEALQSILDRKVYILCNRANLCSMHRFLRVLCPAVLRATPGLRELRLPQCARVTGAAIEQLPALVPHLTCAVIPDVA